MVAANQAYRKDIDGLRALAVLLVLAFHAFPTVVSGGFVGVDVFFVISGFLISGLLFDWMEEGRFPLLHFYARRICRLFPALLLVLGSCLLFGWAALLPDEFIRFGQHARGALLYVLNYVLSAESGYFDVRAETKPLLHLWSLAIEEQFYIFWPLLLFGAYKAKIEIGKLVSFVFLCSLVLCVFYGDRFFHDGFYFPQARFWEFLAGAFLAREKKRLEGRFSFLPFIGLAVIMGAAFLLDAQDPYPEWRALFPVLGTVLVLAGGEKSWFNETVLSNPKVVYIGLISYPLYLWHWPLFSFARMVFGEEALTVAVRFSLLAASFLLASLTFHFVEKPIRFGSLPRGKTALALFLISVFLGMVSFGIEERFLRSYAGLFGPPQLELLESKWPYPPEKANKVDLGDISFYRIGGGGGGVLFLGDCNVQQYLPRFFKRGEERAGYLKTLFFLAKEDCLPVSGIEHPRGECKEYSKAAAAVLVRGTEEKTIDTVVISAHWIYYFYFGKGYKAGGHPLTEKEGREIALANFGKMIREMREKGVQVIVVLNIPAGPEFAPDQQVERSVLSFKMKEGRGGLSFDEMRRHYGSLLEDMRVTATKAGADVIDPMEFLCADGFCPALAADGTFIYKTKNHLHPAFVRDHVTYLDGVLEKK